MSIRELARRTGMSFAAVSQALKGTGRLSPATRSKILAAAEEHGYQPDRILSEAFSRMRQPALKRYRETIAVILEWKTEGGPLYQQQLVAAMHQRAASMGYKLEEFITSGRAAEHRRLSSVLVARGIRGMILIPRLGASRPRLHFDWDKFASVEVGNTLWHPRNLDRVEGSGYQNVFESIHLLKRVGYKRIGMAVEPAQNRSHSGIFYAAYLHSHLRTPPSRRVPIFDPDGPWTEQSFQAWLHQYKPDVLYIHRTVAISSWLAKMGWRVPDDISIFCTNAPNPHWSGLVRDYPGLGVAAVEMVSHGLESRSYGLSNRHRSLLIDEIWQAGETLSRKIDALITENGLLQAKVL